MIKSVTGKIDTQSVAFTFNGTNWVAELPSTKTSYSLELWAEDMAGNGSYMSTILVMYDIAKMCFKFDIVDVAPNWQREEVLALFGKSEVTEMISSDDIDLNVSRNDVVFKVLGGAC